MDFKTVKKINLTYFTNRCYRPGWASASSNTRLQVKWMWRVARLKHPWLDLCGAQLLSEWIEKIVCSLSMKRWNILLVWLHNCLDMDQYFTQPFETICCQQSWLCTRYQFHFLELCNQVTKSCWYAQQVYPGSVKRAEWATPCIFQKTREKISSVHVWLFSHDFGFQFSH